MVHTYKLEFVGEEVELLRSPQSIQTECDFIQRLDQIANRNRIHLMKMQITQLFDKLDTVNHRSDDWRDNLRTLLAHGFRLKKGSDFLTKSYRPLTFNLIPEKGLVAIHFGFFHLSAEESIPGQFIKFCNKTEHPPGIHQHVISSVIKNGGGALYAHYRSGSHLLIKSDPLADTLSGDDDIIHFVLNMAF